MTSLDERLGAEMLDDLRHAVGGGDGGRNYYCAETGGDADARWQVLVGLGLARRGRELNEGRDVYYVATDAGMSLVMATAPKKGKRR